MARPRKGEELGASATIGLRVTEATRRSLEALAKASGRTLTEEIRDVIDAEVRRRLGRARRSYVEQEHVD